MNEISDHDCFISTLNTTLVTARKPGSSLNFSDTSSQRSLPLFFRHKELYTLALSILPRIQKIFSEEDQVSPGLCNQALSDLKDLSSLVKEQKTCLNEIVAHYQKNQIVFTIYQLKMNLYYVEDLLIQIQALIVQLRSLHRSRSRQVVQVRESLAYKLALATRCINDIIPQMRILSDLARFQSRNSMPLDDPVALP